MRAVAAVLILAQLSWSCASTTAIQSIKEESLVFPSPSPGSRKLALVLREFRNSAGISQFDIIPDGTYREGFLRRGAPAGDRPPGPPVPPPGGNKTGTPLPPAVEPGIVAREVAETLLVQTGRFRVVPSFKLDESMHARPDGSVPTLAEAARRVGVRYVMYGDLTQFEIRQKRSYWKVPLWALLLVGALFIKDKEARAFALNTILRIMIYTPLNSSFWDKGLGWEDLILEVEVALSLRLVDTETGLVVHTAEAEITRTETVRNLDLIVWNSDRRLKITTSNAGRQIRFAAHEAIRDILERGYSNLVVGGEGLNATPTTSKK